jgi:hypothetical protein
MNQGMRRPSDSEWIAMWEMGTNQPPIDRALTLLSAYWGASLQEVARLSIGARDARLFEIYEYCFGPTLAAFAQCPVCRQALEYSLCIPDLTARKDEVPPLQLEAGEVSVELRLPNSFDLCAVSGCSDLTQAGRLLMERCVVAAKVEEKPIPAEGLSTDVIEAIAARLAAADPLAEVLIDLTCLACRHQWQVLLDIQRFLWTKISFLARRLLQEVHALASAYGWTEREILALSPARRQSYLEMAWQTS